MPLFINTIGAWPNRPRPKSKVKNLYLAGDFVKNAIDLACMEGAVSAALETACQILSAHGETDSLPVAQVPPMWPRGWLVAARILLIPAVATARLIAWLEEKPLTASTRCFERAPQGNTEAADGLAPTPQAVNRYWGRRSRVGTYEAGQRICRKGCEPYHKIGEREKHYYL